MKTYPAVITGFLPLHPPRPGVVRRLARWAWDMVSRPIEVWLREGELSHLRALDLEDWWREQAYEQVGLWAAAQQIRSLRKVRRVLIDRRQAELDELRGENNG